MTEIMKSEIFFFVSSIGFALVAIMLIVLILYCIRAVRSFQALLEKTENEIDNLGDTAQDLVEDIRGSFIYKMLFNPKRGRLSKIINAKFKKDE